MAQGLQLSQRLTQSLVLAPQLQQSLALLQAPTLELKALVEQELQQNPVLEEAPEQAAEAQDKETEESDKTTDAADPADPAQAPGDLEFDAAAEKNAAEPVDDFQAEFERLVQLDQEWRDHFAPNKPPARASAVEGGEGPVLFSSPLAGDFLPGKVFLQDRRTAFSAKKRAGGGVAP